MTAGGCLWLQLVGLSDRDSSVAESNLLLRHKPCTRMFANIQGRKMDRKMCSQWPTATHLLPIYSTLTSLVCIETARLFPDRHTANPLYHYQIDYLIASYKPSFFLSLSSQWLFHGFFTLLKVLLLELIFCYVNIFTNLTPSVQLSHFPFSVFSSFLLPFCFHASCNYFLTEGYLTISGEFPWSLCFLK